MSKAYHALHMLRHFGVCLEPMHIADLSRGKFSDVTVWALVVAAVFIVVFSLVSRASLNLSAALTDKPDLAVYVLLPEEKITEVKLLRDLGTERDYLVTTKAGQKFVKLHKVEGKWALVAEENLHGSGV